MLFFSTNFISKKRNKKEGVCWYTHPLETLKRQEKKKGLYNTPFSLQIGTLPMHMCECKSWLQLSQRKFGKLNPNLTVRTTRKSLCCFSETEKAKPQRNAFAPWVWTVTSMHHPFWRSKNYISSFFPVLPVTISHSVASCKQHNPLWNKMLLEFSSFVNTPALSPRENPWT